MGKFEPGHKKSPKSGRKKGQITRDRQMLLDKAKLLGVDPFEVLLRFANADWSGLGYEEESRTIHTAGGGSFEERTISPELRAKCAADAAQFMLPKLKALEVENKDDFKPVIVYQSEWGSKLESSDGKNNDED